MCVLIRILRAIATAESFEKRLVSDITLVPALHFMSAEAGTDALERPCVRQLTQAMKRLQKFIHYYATISHSRRLAETLVFSQWIAENPIFRSISVLTGGR